MLAGQHTDHRETDPGTRRQRGEVQRLGGDGPFGAAQPTVAQAQAAVLDGDDQPGRHLLDVDVHLGRRRGERGRVVQQFGERVHHALGGEPGHRGGARVVQPDPLVGADPAERAAQHRLHRDRPTPTTARAGAGQHRDAVGHPARLGGRVVQPQQVAEDLLVVPVLHLAQFRVHARGQRLHPAGRGGADRQGGGPQPLAAADLLRHGTQQRTLRVVAVRGQGGVHGRTAPQSLHEDRQHLVGDPVHGGPLGALRLGLRPGPRRLRAGGGGLLLGPGERRPGLVPLGLGGGGPRLGGGLGLPGRAGDHEGRHRLALPPAQFQLQPAGPFGGAAGLPDGDQPEHGDRRHGGRGQRTPGVEGPHHPDRPGHRRQQGGGRHNGPGTHVGSTGGPSVGAGGFCHRCGVLGRSRANARPPGRRRGTSPGGVSVHAVGRSYPFRRCAQPVS